MKKPELVTLIKLGGSVITEKSQVNQLRAQVLQNLGSQIKRALTDSPQLIIIGHGQGSFGHIPAKKYGLPASALTAEQISELNPDEIEQGKVETRQAVITLHKMVIKELTDTGLPVSSLLMQELVRTENYLAKNPDLSSIFQLLESGQIPVTTGDVLDDILTGAMIWSTERIFQVLIEFIQNSPRFRIEKQIMVTDVAGVLDQNGKLIAKIDLQSLPQALGAITPANHPDVTGGMQHKLVTALEQAKAGIETQILSGLSPNQLYLSLTHQSWTGTSINY